MTLVEPVVDLDWMGRAACAGMNRNIFFPEYEFLTDAAALAACGRCSVKAECLEYAIRTHQEFGIWGGLTESQRQAIDTTRSRAKCPDCRSDRIIEEVRSEVCISCGLSWPV